jgi:hypothetical protein
MAKNKRSSGGGEYLTIWLSLWIWLPGVKVIDKIFFTASQLTAPKVVGTLRVP